MRPFSEASAGVEESPPYLSAGCGVGRQPGMEHAARRGQQCASFSDECTSHFASCDKNRKNNKVCFQVLWGGLLTLPTTEWFVRTACFRLSAPLPPLSARRLARWAEPVGWVLLVPCTAQVWISHRRESPKHMAP